MRRLYCLLIVAGAAFTAAFAQNYASYNNQPVARPSFLRSQWPAASKNVYQDSSLILYLPLIRTTGTFNDYSGNNESGTFTNTPVPTWYNGKVGTYAPYFNKSSENYINFANAPTITVPFTVNVWVKPNTPVGGYTRIIESDYAKGFYLGLDSTMTKYQLIVNDSAIGSCNGGTVSTGTWPNEAWQMVTGVYNGTSGYLYVNGAQVAGPCTFTSPGTQSLPIRAGYCYVSGYCATTTGAWDGQIGAIRIYNRQLSATEIATIYTAEKN